MLKLFIFLLACSPIIALVTIVILWSNLSHAKKQRDQFHQRQELYQRYFMQLLARKRISKEEFTTITDNIANNVYDEIRSEHQAEEHINPMTLPVEKPAPPIQEKFFNPNAAIPNLKKMLAMAKKQAPSEVATEVPMTVSRQTLRFNQQFLPKFPAVNAITLVLAIGVLFIVLAGMIFATTSWQYFSNFTRTVIICSLVPLFFLTAAVAEQKLKLPQTGVAFYTLGCCFLPITVLAVGYFRFLGDWFSIFGGGKYMLGMAAALMMCAATARGTLKYRSVLYLWTTLTCLTLAVFCLIKYTTTTNDYLILCFTVYCWLAAWYGERTMRSYTAVQQKYMPLLEQFRNFSMMNIGMLGIAAAAVTGNILTALLAAAVFLGTFIKDAANSRKLYYAVYPLAVCSTLAFSKAFGAVLLFRTGWTDVLFGAMLLLVGCLTWAWLRFSDRLFQLMHPVILLALFSGASTLYHPAGFPPGTLFSLLAVLGFVVYLKGKKIALRTNYSDMLFAGICLLNVYGEIFHLLFLHHSMQWGRLLSSYAALVIFGLLHICATESSGRARQSRLALCLAALLGSFLSQLYVPWDWRLLGLALLLIGWFTWLLMKKREQLLFILQPLVVLYSLYCIADWFSAWMIPVEFFGFSAVILFILYDRTRVANRAVTTFRSIYSDLFCMFCCLWGVYAPFYYTPNSDAITWAAIRIALVALVPFAILHIRHGSEEKPHQALYIAAVVIGFFLINFSLDWNYWKLLSGLAMLGSLSWMLLKRHDRLLYILQPLLALFCVFGFTDLFYHDWSAEIFAVGIFIAFFIYVFYRPVNRAVLSFRTKFSDNLWLFFSFFAVLWATLFGFSSSGYAWISIGNVPLSFLPALLFFLLLLFLSAENKTVYPPKSRISTFLMPYAFFWIAPFVTNTLNSDHLFFKNGHRIPFGDVLLLFLTVFTAAAIAALLLHAKRLWLQRYEVPCGIALLACGSIGAAKGLFHLEGLTLFSTDFYPAYLWLVTAYTGVQFYLWFTKRHETALGRRLKNLLLDVFAVSLMTSIYLTAYSAFPEVKFAYLLCAPALSAALLWGIYAYFRYGKKTADSPLRERLFVISSLSLHWYSALSVALYLIDNSLPLYYGSICIALIGLSYISLYLHRNTIYGAIFIGLLYPIAFAAASRLITYSGGSDHRLSAALITFILMAALGRILFNTLTQRALDRADDAADIDWFTLWNFIGPLSLLWLSPDRQWLFFSCLLWAVYALTYYNRLTKQYANATALTFALAALCAAYWVQPYFIFPAILETELNLLPLLLFFLLLHKKIWRGQTQITGTLLFSASAYAVVRLGVDVVYLDQITDSLLMGVGALALLLGAFWHKKKRWFLLAFASLLFLAIYMTKDYWFNLAWWVYLLTVGMVLIGIATINEWCRKHDTSLAKKCGRFMEDWEW